MHAQSNHFVYIVFCNKKQSNILLQMDPDDAMTHELTTTLRSELAAMEYKRDRLVSEVNRLLTCHLH